MKKLLFIILTSISYLSAETSKTQIVELNKSNIESMYALSKPIIIEVYATDCYCCQRLTPIFNDLHREYGSLYQFTRLNIKKESYFINYFELKTIPTIIFIKDGREIFRHAGTITKENFKSEIKRHLRP